MGGEWVGIVVVRKRILVGWAQPSSHYVTNFLDCKFENNLIPNDL